MDNNSLINDFHLPFLEEDLSILSLQNEDWFIHDFGAGGLGMEDAMSISPEQSIEFMSSADETNETYRLLTIIQATGDSIPSELIYEVKQEAEQTGKPFAFFAQQKLAGIATVKTVITPTETIPDIAKRTPHVSR